MLKTPLTKLLNIRVPIVQGGMQWVGVPQLAATVSNAGALGILTAFTQPSPEALRTAIRETRRLTDRPFGVNITFLPSITPKDFGAYARAAVEEGVRIFETAGNNPGSVLTYLKENKCVVIHKCTSIRHAKAAEKLGIDVVSMDGLECAGYPGEDDVGGLILLARASQELKIPYIASGGIADGRGLAAALALGAAGVNMGTRFLCTVESPIHPNIKQTIVGATEHQTTHILRTLRNSARVYANSVAQHVRTLEARPGGAQFSELQDLVSGERGRRVFMEGDVEAGVWSAGACVGLIHDVPTVAELVERMVREAEAVIDGIAAMKRSESRL